MKYKYPLFFGAIGLLVLFIGIVFYWWIQNSKPVSTDTTTVRFVIPKGKSAIQVGTSLEKLNIIKSSLAFKIYVQMTNSSRKIKPGEYNLSPSLNLKEILSEIIKGPDEIWVTIPEGLRREEIAQKIISQLQIQEPNFYSEFMEASLGKEGYLFPDTYLFPYDITAQKVVQKMLLTFDEKFNQLVIESKTTSQRTKSEIVVMASIIERETKTNEERPIVAGILWKRLDTEGWYLQADATLQYAIANSKLKTVESKLESYWPILTREDLEINSLYNSYKVKALPPTPIASPGLSSLKAAMNPEDSANWFYIHDTEGIIHFGRTIQEHNMNISKYLGK